MFNSDWATIEQPLIMALTIRTVKLVARPNGYRARAIQSRETGRRWVVLWKPNINRTIHFPDDKVQGTPQGIFDWPKTIEELKQHLALLKIREK